MSTAAALDALAAFTALTSHEGLPASLRTHGAWVLMDVIGAALAGSTAAEASALAAACIAESGPGPATLLRQGLPRSGAATAAWLNGTCAVWLELDPGHRRCRTHAPAHVFPAALAEAERSGASGEALLSAFVIGCEVAYRVAPPTR